MIHGYASRTDMARLSNMYHLQNFHMNVDAWHEWVPSEANIADIPSRPRFDKKGNDLWQQLWDLKAEQIEMLIPEPEQWDDLKKWCTEVCSNKSSTSSI